MTTLPITDAEEIIRRSVYQALAPLMSAYTWTPNGGAARAKCYWKLAEQGVPLPYVIAQPQSDFADASPLNGAGIEAMLTVKALAASLADAATLLALITPGMSSLAIPAGYTGYSSISSRYLRSPPIPPLEGVWPAAHIFQLSLYRT